MSAAAATKPKTNRRAKAPLSAVPSAPGSIVIPAKCKPSKGMSTDRTRPVLTHGYLRRRDDGLWLCTTDSYIAVAVKVDGEAQEGYIPAGALRLMERGQKAEQVSNTAWKVWTREGTVVFDCDDSVKGATNFPDFAQLGMWDKWPDVEGGFDKAEKFEVGFNPAFAKRVGEGLGADQGCRFAFSGPLKVIRCAPVQQHTHPRLGLLMPVRITV